MLVRLLAASGALEVHARTLRELRRELAAKAAKQPRLQAARCGGSAAAGGLRPLRPLGCFAALAASSLGPLGVRKRGVRQTPLAHRPLAASWVSCKRASLVSARELCNPRGCLQPAVRSLRLSLHKVRKSYHQINFFELELIV